MTNDHFADKKLNLHINLLYFTYRPVLMPTPNMTCQYDHARILCVHVFCINV